MTNRIFRHLATIVIVLLSGCSTVSTDPNTGTYQEYRSDLPFAEVVKKFRALLDEQATISNMTRTGGCFEDAQNSTDKSWTFICGHNPGFLGPSHPSKAMFSTIRRVIVVEGVAATRIQMTPVPIIDFGAYTPSNLEILTVARIPASLISQAKP